MILTFFSASSLLFLWFTHVFTQLELSLQAEGIFKECIGELENEMRG